MMGIITKNNNNLLHIMWRIIYLRVVVVRNIIYLHNVILTLSCTIHRLYITLEWLCHMHFIPRYWYTSVEQPVTGINKCIINIYNTSEFLTGCILCENVNNYYYFPSIFRGAAGRLPELRWTPAERTLGVVCVRLRTRKRRSRSFFFVVNAILYYLLYYYFTKRYYCMI